MNIIIPGVMRCGTTSLRNYLSRHPDISQPKRREIDYFNDNYDKGKRWYELQLGKGGLDKSPNYLANPSVPRRIYNDYPNAKVVVLLRNPVDRALSHYRWLQSVKGYRRPFSTLLSPTHEDGWYNVLNRGHYAEQLAPWLRLFSTIVVKSEDLFTAPRRTYGTILRFLELPLHDLRDFRKHGTVRAVGEMSRNDAQFLTEYYAPHNQALYSLIGRDMGW